MSRPLLTTLIASTLAFAPAADVRLYEASLPEDNVPVCIERRKDRTIVAALYSDRLTLYYDNDRSGRIGEARDRVVEFTPESWRVYYPDGVLDLATGVFRGTITRRDIRRAENEEDWRGYLAAVGRFERASVEYASIMGSLDEGWEAWIPGCEVPGALELLANERL